MQFLSHITSEGDPGWPGNPTLKISPFSQIGQGDVANTYSLEYFNHFGTHMDAPNHFNAQGLPVTALPADLFVYRHPYLLDQPLRESELLTARHLGLHDLEGVDCLLIRSGFEQYRHTNPMMYAERGPGIGSDAATYLMDYCPALRVIVLDWISISAYQQLDDGFLAHQILSGAKGHDHFILGIEDACLARVQTAPSWVVALPIRVDGIDGGPCTIIAG